MHRDIAMNAITLECECGQKLATPFRCDGDERNREAASCYGYHLGWSSIVGKKYCPSCLSAIQIVPTKRTPTRLLARGVSSGREFAIRMPRKTGTPTEPM